MKKGVPEGKKATSVPLVSYGSTRSEKERFARMLILLQFGSGVSQNLVLGTVSLLCMTLT